VEFHPGDPGNAEKPLLNHVAVLVDEVEPVIAEAEERDIVDNVVDAANTRAVFASPRNNSAMPRLKRTGNVVSARRNVIIGAFLGALVFLAPVLFVKSLPVMAASMSLSFFFLEMTIGPIWAVPMDITPKHVGIASGLVNAGSAVAGIFSPIVFGFVVDHTGSWTLPFAGSVGLLAIGIVMTFFMRPDIALDTGVDHDDKTATHQMTLADRLR